MDLSTLSDQELMDLYSKASAPQSAPAPNKPVQEMTDAELMAAREQARGPWQKLTGQGGERYQTWPERLVRGIGNAAWSGFTAPGDALQGKLPPEQVLPRALDAAAIFTPTAPRVGLTAARPMLPTGQQLLKSGADKINEAKAMGVEIAPEAISNWATATMRQLESPPQGRGGFTADNAPVTFQTLSKLASGPKPAPGENVVGVTITNLHDLRQALGNIAGEGAARPTDAAAAARAIRHLDDYMSSLPQSDVLVGEAVPAAQALKQGLGDYAAGSRSAAIDEAQYAAGLNASAANSGRNIGNAERQKFKSLILGDETSGFSPAELAQTERVVRGTPVGNALRTTGNLLGGGGGLGQAVTAGMGAAAGTAATGGPWGAALGASAPAILGNIARALSNKSVDRQIEILKTMIRARSPTAEALMANAPKVPQQEAITRDAIVRALLGESVAAQ